MKTYIKHAIGAALCFTILGGAMLTAEASDRDRSEPSSWYASLSGVVSATGRIEPQPTLEKGLKDVDPSSAGKGIFAAVGRHVGSQFRLEGEIGSHRARGSHSREQRRAYYGREGRLPLLQLGREVRLREPRLRARDPAAILNGSGKEGAKLQSLDSGSCARTVRGNHGDPCKREKHGV